jgi:hypothetical protein
MPLFLALNRELYEEVAKRIQSGLFSKDLAQVDGALLGLRNWIIYSVKGDLPPPPSQFLYHFIAFIAERRPVGIDRALMYLTDLMLTVPDVFEERHLELVLLGMTSLIEETDVRALVDAGDIDTPDKPYVRSRAAKLACQLSRYYQNLGTELPATTERWRVVCENDPLIQVRTAWRN